MTKTKTPQPSEPDLSKVTTGGLRHPPGADIPPWRRLSKPVLFGGYAYNVWMFRGSIVLPGGRVMAVDLTLSTDTPGPLTTTEREALGNATIAVHDLTCQFDTTAPLPAKEPAK